MSVLVAVDAAGLVADDAAVLSSMTRLRIWSTMPASWVAMTTVVPVRLIRSSSFMMPTEVFGSRLPVGSSAMRIIGRLTNARAIATRCCSPPDSSSGIRSPLPSRPTSSSVSGTTLLDVRRGLADHLERERDVLA